MAVSVRPRVESPRDPWFRQHPRLVLAVVVLLFVAVLSLRLFTGNAASAYSMLYVFPVALVATAFGRNAGGIAGTVAVALMVLWAVTQHVSLTPLAWAARALPMLLLGLLLGDAADRIRRAEAERHRLETAALLHREAIEINDSLVQGMVAAKWSLESGRVDAGRQTLDETIDQAHGLVSGLIRQAGMANTKQPSARE